MNYIITGVPDIATFHKYWVVRLKDKNTCEYVISFYEVSEALEYMNTEGDPSLFFTMRQESKDLW